MADIKGFMKYRRVTSGYRPVYERLNDFSEVEKQLNTDERIRQAARCMDCGIPFCTWGCSIANIIPEFQDMVYKERWKEAYELLSVNHNFPEFTGRVCPAPCEHACVLNIDQEPVTIRENELTVIEKAFKEGYVKPRIPEIRSGKKVAVIGSGPAGLTVADELNQKGHSVTIFEKAEAVGGLLRFGIPDFKLNKAVIERRVKIMEEEGIIFKVNVDVGKNIETKAILKEFDAIVLAVGAMKPRDIPVEGRDLRGIHFAMDYLTQQNRIVSDISSVSKKEGISAHNKRVLVIGGGDTGSDCVGTSNRHDAKSVMQIEIMPKPDTQRKEDNPWPFYAWTLRTSSSHEEGCERRWNLTTNRFIGKEGNVSAVEVEEVSWEPGDQGKMIMKKSGKKEIIETDLVLLALGFVSPLHDGLLNELGIEYDARGNVEVNEQFMSSVDKVFAVGDSVTGASLVVKAMEQGKKSIQSIHEFLEIHTQQ